MTCPKNPTYGGGFHVEQAAQCATKAEDFNTALLNVLEDFVLDWDNGLVPSVDRLRGATPKVKAGA